MELYKIYQKVNNRYDTYDAAIVAAENEEEARRISPNDFHEIGADDRWYFKYSDGHIELDDDSAWADIKDVRVEYIGEAKSGTDKGLILGSFNAG